MIKDKESRLNLHIFNQHVDGNKEKIEEILELREKYLDLKKKIIKRFSYETFDKFLLLSNSSSFELIDFPKNVKSWFNKFLLVKKEYEEKLKSCECFFSELGLSFFEVCPVAYDI